MDVIVAHVKADFDALGGLVGARRLYPGSIIVLPGGEQPGVREFLQLHREVLDPRVPSEVDPETITRLIVVDTSTRRRLGKAAAWLDLPGVEVHLYDHHMGEEVDCHPVQERRLAWGSVSSILVHDLRERGETLTPVEATTLLLGIYEDTGSLSFTGTTPEDVEAAAWLLRSGGELEVVSEFTRRALSPDQRRLLAEALEGAETLDVRGVPVGLAVTQAGAYVDQASVVPHRMLEMDEVNAVFLIAPMEEVLYVIGRSNSDAVDVGGVIRELGGGGHARAASANLKQGDPVETRERLLRELPRFVRPEVTARQIMSHPVRSIRPDATVGDARQRMIRYGHSGLVVLEEGRMVGIITRRDVDKARHHHLEHAPVRGFMTREVKTVELNTPLSELERVMIAEGLGRLPVVRRGDVLGIVTRRDVLRALHGERYLTGSPAFGPEPAPQLLRERLPANVQRLLAQVGEAAERADAKAYAVGGFVRDLLLDVRNLDVDILVEPDGIALARAVAEECGGEVAAHDRFGTATVKLPDGFKIDFTTARTESYAHPGALPEVEPSSILDDLRRRDFTINALAVALRPEEFGELLDPFGGRVDLERRRVRVLHALSFVEDPTRLFRAVRFEERLHFQMDGHTEGLARHAVETDALARISPERLRAELFRTLREERSLAAMLRLDELGVFAWMQPDLRPDRDLLQSLEAALGWWKDHGKDPLDRCVIYLAGLLAPLGPERAAQTAESRLRLPPPDLEKLGAALRIADQAAGLLPAGATPAEVHRRLQPLRPEQLVFLRALAADCLEASAVQVLDRYVREWRHVKLEITGEDLKALGYRPGPALGAALRETLEARLNGGVEGREGELAHACAVLNRFAD